MKRHLARALTIFLIGSGTLVACGNDQDACAAPSGNQPKPVTRNNQRPTTQRTTSKVQDKPRTSTSKNSKANQRPTNWSGYNDRVQQRNWTKPYRQGYPVPQRPVTVNEYRYYPGYHGYYPVGVWPVGYGHTYGCHAEQEAAPAVQEPTPAPTVTITETATPAPTETPVPTTVASLVPTAEPK